MFEFRQYFYIFGKPSAVRVEWYPHVSSNSQRGRHFWGVKGRFFRFFVDSALTKSTFTPKTPLQNGNGWYHSTGIWLRYTNIIGACTCFFAKMFQGPKIAKNAVFWQFFAKNRIKTIFLNSTDSIFFIRWFFRKFWYQICPPTWSGSTKSSVFGPRGVDI